MRAFERESAAVRVDGELLLLSLLGQSLLSPQAPRHRRATQSSLVAFIVRNDDGAGAMGQVYAELFGAPQSSSKSCGPHLRCGGIRWRRARCRLEETR